jgi:hypothetical protein
MSEPDPVTTLLRELDRPIEPRPEFADALRARLLEELSHTDGAPVGHGVQPPRRALPARFRRPLLAGALALAIVAAVIATGVVSRPSPASALDVIRQARAAFAHMPPFQATFKVAFNPDGAKGDRFVPKGATQTVLVSYGGPDRFRLQVVAEHPGHRLANESNPGYYEVSDGRRYGIFEPRGSQRIFHSYPVSPGSPGGLYGLSWHGAFANWDRVCRGPGSKVLADVRIAGRDARHISCTDFTGQTWQLWIDRQTGLMLKIVGRVALGDSFLGGGPTTTSKGGFQVEELRYHPSFPAGTFAVKTPPGAVDPEARQRAALAKLPPFHAVFAERGHPNYVDEAWWQNEHTWRRQRVYERRSDPSFIGPGSFTVKAHRHMGTYNAKTNTFSPNSATLNGLGDPAQQLLQLDPLYAEGASCTIIGHEPIAGRKTNHYRCDGEQVWVDAATRLTLKVHGRHYELRVRSIQYHPHFPARTFHFIPPAGSRNANKIAKRQENDPLYNTKLAPGKAAPNWRAVTLAGKPFQLTDLRGKPTLLLILIAENCNDPVCNQLAPLEHAYRHSNGATRPVWVDWGGTPRGANKLARFDHLTYPVIIDRKGASQKAWAFHYYPYWLLLDSHGRVITARQGIQTVDQLEHLLAQG